MESTNIETFRQGLVLLDALAIDDKSIYIDYRQTLENQQCMDVLVHKGKQRCVLTIEKLGMIDVQLGLRKTKEISVSGISCETICGPTEIQFHIPDI